MTYTQTSGIITATVANVRSGPGTEHPVIGQALQGESYIITGRNAPGDWYQIAGVNNQLGWVYGELLAVQDARADIPVVGPAAPPPPPVHIQGWKGEYFPNQDLQGSPLVVRDDPDINFHWGGASPAPGLAGTNFSVRWTRTLYFEGGDYTFYATADDGVRVKLDGWGVIDQWRVSSAQTYSGTFKNVGAGNHTITVEYFQAGGDALAHVWWERRGEGGADRRPSGNVWHAEYFNDIHLQGSPLVIREETNLDHNWSLGSPDPLVPGDNFSARWTRQAYLEGGIHKFYAYVSDGVRVYVDGRAIIDEWHDADGAPTYIGQFDSVGGGTHTVIVE
ncbi:MAG TPA: SH3 domain-containing protein, partial [Caldilineae bacterium]|nr:SH3 domain-containing protein [Caldilineae bacterium]